MKRFLYILIIANFIFSFQAAPAMPALTKTCPVHGCIDYLYNRNAISDFDIVGKDIIALTESGNILKFDSKYKLTGELIDTMAYTCIGGKTGNKILLGRADGSMQLDAKPLSLPPERPRAKASR